MLLNRLPAAVGSRLQDDTAILVVQTCPSPTPVRALPAVVTRRRTHQSIDATAIFYVIFTPIESLGESGNPVPTAVGDRHSSKTR